MENLIDQVEELLLDCERRQCGDDSHRLQQVLRQLELAARATTVGLMAAGAGQVEDQRRAASEQRLALAFARQEADRA